VRLVIDPGQYAVRFVVPAQSTGHRRFLWGAAIVFLILLATAPLVFVVFYHSKMPEALVDAAPKGLNSVQREVLLNQSPATLEAVDLATQARSLIFPASNPARLIATRGMFERSVELSPNYFGGHAGLAQVLGLQSFLAPPGPDRDALIERGIQHAQTALNLSPASPWTQSALGWVEFVRGNVDTARSLSEQAVQIDPDDLDILNFDSLIGIFSGDFQHVVASANPANFEGRSLRRHAFTISYAIARYHLGEDAAAIAAFNKATALGAPISPISFAYLIAAHQRLGEQQVARNLLQDFETSWPNSRMEPVMRRLFTRPGDADTLFDALHDAGWQTTVNQTGSVERP
jgi:tetratricopeptide (TPR) repeat protein